MSQSSKGLGSHFMRRIEVCIYLGSIVLASGWIAVLFLPPGLMADGQVVPALILYRSFSLICHQIPERSFQAFGAPLAVCSRCTAIYVGALGGLLIYPSVRTLLQRLDSHTRGSKWGGRGWFVVALLPMAIDVAADWLGLLPNSFTSRAVTGGIAGLAAALCILPGVIAAFDEWYRSERPSGLS